MTTEVSFVVLATAGLEITGWLGAGSQLLGGRSFAETLSGPSAAALGAWMVSGTLVSLALPVLALAIWGRHEGVMRALLPYVLVAQILIEMVFAEVFFQNIVILTGTTFTLYRLGQLVSARRAFAETEGAGRHGRAVGRHTVARARVLVDQPGVPALRCAPPRHPVGVESVGMAGRDTGRAVF